MTAENPTPAPRPRLIYHPGYNIGLFGLERLHPFDSRKYGRAWAELLRRFGRPLRRITLRPRGPVSREDLLLVHTPEHLRRLKDSDYLARALEVPPLRHLPAWLIDRIVLRPMRLATAGTILAAREALRCGLAVNLSGGYHHAGPESAEGFSIYNDIAVAVRVLRREGKLGERDRVVYVDCDAHQGNGVCRAFADDPRVFIFDLYNAAIYPADAKARRRIDCDVPVWPGTTGPEYLAALADRLPPFLNSVVGHGAARLAIYNAGTDVYAGDPLGRLAVDAPGMLERDRFVLGQLTARGLPVVMLPSGGYTRDSYRLIAETVADLLKLSPPS